MDDRKASEGSHNHAPPRLHGVFWAGWSVVAAFGTYFCMYGFRKPFTAASFADFAVLGISFKTLLVTTQIAGYMLSKFIGVKVVSEMPRQRRAVGVLVLIACAEVSLLLFGLTPRPWNAAFLFGNGLSLGMVFGLVIGFLEGRRLTDALTAGLCCSFILGDGVTKSLGAWLLKQQVPEDWMPCSAGLLFLAPLSIFVAMLSLIPPPTASDITARAERVPMTSGQRWTLLDRYAIGLALLVMIYLLISILRSIRADFAAEIWQGLLGQKAQPATFTNSEYFVALGVLIVNGSLVCVRDSRWAFFTSLSVCGVGMGLMTLAIAGLQTRLLDGFPFMVLMGLGLYLPYVAMHTTVFERFLAMTRERGNLGFLMYVADSIGYLGVVGVLIARNVFTTGEDFLGDFVWIASLALGLAAICLILSWRYFSLRCPAEQTLLTVKGET